MAEASDDACSAPSQVHRATLHDGRKVVLKIQYPGVARSIESDVDNLLRIITYANFLPKGLYVEAAAKVPALSGLCAASLLLPLLGRIYAPGFLAYVQVSCCSVLRIAGKYTCA